MGNVTEPDDEIAGPTGMTDALRASHAISDQVTAALHPVLAVTDQLAAAMRVPEFPEFRVSQEIFDHVTAALRPVLAVTDQLAAAMRVPEFPEFRVSQEIFDHVTAALRPVLHATDQLAEVERDFDLDPSQWSADDIAATRSEDGQVNASETACTSASPTWLEEMRQFRDSLDRRMAEQRAVAEQVDERLALEAMTDVDGICWRCGNPALTADGVACRFCADEILAMMLAVWSLIEELESG